MSSTARIENGQLIVEGSPLGLSFHQIATRKERNLFKIDTVYVYKFELPKYLKGQETRITQDLINEMQWGYDDRIVVNEEVGRYFFGKETANDIAVVLLMENTVQSLKTGREFRRIINNFLTIVKRPYYRAWRETRQSTKSVSYVKPSQLTV